MKDFFVINCNVEEGEALQQQSAKSLFEYYQKSTKKILKDEDVIAKIPAIVLSDVPKELLCIIYDLAQLHRIFL